jgi:hypothetical protein
LPRKSNQVAAHQQFSSPPPWADFFCPLTAGLLSKLSQLATIVVCIDWLLMLPAPPSLNVWIRSLKRNVQRVLVVCVLLLLNIGLTGCGPSDQPPRGVLLKALGLQIQLTQTAIARSLELEPVGVPEVSRVRVEEQESIRLGEQRGIHLTGRFDWRLPSDSVRVDSPFELFLERGERGQSWRLAQPVGSSDGTSQDWMTHPLPID